MNRKFCLDKVNAGVIAQRYATALFEFVESGNDPQKVYSQVRVILSSMRRVEKLRSILQEHFKVSLDERLGLLNAAVAPDTLSPELESFVRLLDTNGRMSLLQLSLLDFLGMYRDAHGYVMLQVTTATPSETLIPLISDTVRKKYGKTPVVNHVVNPDIIGGFICESWGYRLDASVRAALQRTCEQLIDKHKKTL